MSRWTGEGSDPSSTLVGLLEARAEAEPTRLAYAYLKDGEALAESCDYATLRRDARRVAAALQARVAPGERALLLFPPGLDFIRAFYGCLYAQVVAVPTYPPHPTRHAQALPRLRAIVENAAPQALLTVAALGPVTTALRAAEPALARLEEIAVDALPAGAEDAWRQPDVRPETLAFLQYTSGSTALPKGVMVSHGNLVDNIVYSTDVFETQPGDVMVSWLPLYHDMGLIGGVLHSIHARASTYLMSPAAFLQRPLRWLQAISRYGGTIAGAPNFAYDLCVRRTTEAQRATLDLRRWKVAFNGSEPVRAATLTAFARTFAASGFRPEAFCPCYGLAEATLQVTGSRPGIAPAAAWFDVGGLARGRAQPPPEGAPARELVGSGPTWRAQQVAIADPETCRRLEDGAVGEIWVKGANVAQGYWRRPEETARTFQARLADGDGPFLRTGDLGFLRGGELYVSGRLKDLIIVDGKNHYPQDIELTVEQAHPAIRAGCAGAFSLEIGGAERVVVAAEVEVDPRAARAESGPAPASAGADIARAVRAAVSAGHDLEIHDVVLLRPGAIPKTSSGKIRRHACREGFLDGSLERWGSPRPAGAPVTSSPAV